MYIRKLVYINSHFSFTPFLMKTFSFPKAIAISLVTMVTTFFFTLSFFNGADDVSAEIVEADGSILLDSIISGVTNPTCLDNYATWPSSSEYRSDAKWSLSLMPRGSGPIYQDVNGDGLTDYIYSSKNTSVDYYGHGVISTWSCVLLNNGNGWDVTHRCVAVGAPEGAIFYGDCAG